MIVSISHSYAGYKNIEHLFGDFENDVWYKFGMGDIFFAGLGLILVKKLLNAFAISFISFTNLLSILNSCGGSVLYPLFKTSLISFQVLPKLDVTDLIVS